MIGKFECHITVPPTHRQDAETIGKSFGFWTSAITGDEDAPYLPLFFLTKNDVVYENLVADMHECRRALHANGIRPSREKIEFIIHDQRYP
jgi:hypothetical protein